jgi:GT2 family glycosyltransferase
VDPKWLATLVSTMEKDQTIGLAQSLILNMDGQSIQGGGCLISDFWILQWPIGRTNESYSDKFPNVFEISFAMGTAMIIKREFLQEIGLFDPKYFWYYDDDYLSFRTWLAGKRVVTVSNSKVRHVGGGTRRKETYNIEQFYLTIDFISLNLSFYRELRYLIISLFINVVNMIRESLREIITERKALRFWGNMTAARWILRNFRYMWKNRLKYWSKAVINEKTLMHRMIRINIPTSVYLVPRLLFPLYKSETNKYQKKLMEQHQRELQHSGAREEIWQGTGSSVS